MIHGGDVHLSNNVVENLGWISRDERIGKRENRISDLERITNEIAVRANGKRVEFNSQAADFETDEQANDYASLFESLERTNVLVKELTIEPMLEGVEEANKEQQKKHFEGILCKEYNDTALAWFTGIFIEKLDNLLTAVKLVSEYVIIIIDMMQKCGLYGKEGFHQMAKNQYFEILERFKRFLVDNKLINITNTTDTSDINKDLLEGINSNIETRQEQILQIDDEVSEIMQDESIEKAVQNIAFLPFVLNFMPTFKEAFPNMRIFQNFYKKHKAKIIKKVDEDELSGKNSFSDMVSLLDDKRIKKNIYATIGAPLAGETIKGDIKGVLKYKPTDGDPRKIDDLVETLKYRHEAENQYDRAVSQAETIANLPGALSDAGKAVTKLTHLNDKKNKEKEALSGYFEGMIVDSLAARGYTEDPVGSGIYKKDDCPDINVKEEVEKKVKDFEGGVDKSKSITDSISSLASSIGKGISVGAAYNDLYDTGEYDRWCFARKVTDTISNGSKLIGSAANASKMKKSSSEVKDLVSKVYSSMKFNDDGSISSVISYRIKQISETTPGSLVPVLPKDRREGLGEQLSDKKMSRLQAVVELKNGSAYYEVISSCLKNVRLLKQAEALEIRMNAFSNKKRRSIMGSVSKGVDLLFGSGGLLKYGLKTFDPEKKSKFSSYMGTKIDPQVEAAPHLWSIYRSVHLAGVIGSIGAVISNFVGYKLEKKEEESGIKEGLAFGKLMRMYVETEVPEKGEIYKGYDFVKGEFERPINLEFMKKFQDAANLFEDTRTGLGSPSLLNELVISSVKYGKTNEEEDFKEDDDDLDMLSGKDKKENELVNMARILHMQVSSEV